MGSKLSLLPEMSSGKTCIRNDARYSRFEQLLLFNSKLDLSNNLLKNIVISQFFDIVKKYIGALG